MRVILNDYEANVAVNESFISYYNRQGERYFYNLLKPLADTTNLKQSDFIDWGSEQAYEKAVGVGECAGVVIDLIATLLLESEEKLENASESLKLNQFSDSIYDASSSIVNTAKALLTSEEIDYIEFSGIETEVVSGISSSMAVPASQGISLTKRGISESFWVITGTTSKRKLSNDVYLSAQSTATIVILMGMSKLSEIVAIFKKYGKTEIPTAIIQNGTTASEKLGLGTINTIEEVVSQKQLSSPAIIVIGEVVKESSKLRSFYESLNLVENQY